MKVLDLLDEIEEIVETASGFPLTGKVMIDGGELLDIVNEIRAALPDDIQQAQWIKNERDRVLNEAKKERDTIVSEAERRAEAMTEDSAIMMEARQRATSLMESTEYNVKQMKMKTYDYLDGILFHFQERMGALSDVYFNDMFGKLENAFSEVNGTLSANRDEIKEMAYKTSMGMEEYAPMRETAKQRSDDDDDDEIPEGYEEYYEDEDN